MFGIGFEEFFIIAIVLLLAVGPDKMPTFLKAVGKGMREFRRATRELKNSVGLDELMRDEDLRELRKPITSPSPTKRARPPRYEISHEDETKEYPSEGADLSFLEAHPPRSEEERKAEAAPHVVPDPPGPTVEGKLEPVGVGAGKGAEAPDEGDD